MTWRPANLLISSLLAGAILSGCARKSFVQEAPAAASGGLLKVTLSTDWYPEAELGGFYQALARGFYKDAGLDVTILPGGPGSYPVQNLALGKVQFSVAASDEVVMDVAHGIPIVIVGAFLEHYPEAVLIHSENPVKSFADLNGKRVVGVPGSGWIAYVQKRYGIQFSVTPMNFEIARFLADPTLIQQCYITNEPFYVAKAGVKARTLLVSDSGYDPYRVIIVTRSFLEAHPDTVAKFVAASTRGWEDFALNDATPGVDSILRLNSKATREFVEQSVAVLRDRKIITGDPVRGERVGAMTRERFEEQIRIMADIHNIEAVYPVERLATFQFTPPRFAPPK